MPASDEDQNEDTEISPDTDPIDTENVAAFPICDSLAFDSDLPPPTSSDVFRKFSGCESCHRSNPTGLTFRNPFSELVDRPSFQVPDMDRVEPFDVNASYLWHKLCDTHKTVGGQGGQMPYDGEGIDEADMEEMGRWILAGALE